MKSECIKSKCRSEEREMEDRKVNAAYMSPSLVVPSRKCFCGLVTTQRIGNSLEGKAERTL